MIKSYYENDINATIIRENEVANITTRPSAVTNQLYSLHNQTNLPYNDIRVYSVDDLISVNKIHQTCGGENRCFAPSECDERVIDERTHQTSRGDCCHVCSGEFVRSVDSMCVPFSPVHQVLSSSYCHLIIKYMKSYHTIESVGTRISKNCFFTESHICANSH